jgi:predicted TIM-barrel fold metal-dependent hydrolase
VITSSSVPYAGEHVIHDADSHFMEHPQWLAAHADPADDGRLHPVPLGGFEPLIAAGDARQRALRTEPGADRAAAAELLVRKNWDALGAFDAADRTRALDLLGFRSQLVFSSFCHPVLVRDPDLPAIAYDDDLLYAMARAHNRGMAQFCAGDDRLLAVAFVPLDDPGRALAAATDALDNGCAAVEIPSYPAAHVSISHPLFDPLYALLEDRSAPLLFHVGGGGHLVPGPYERPGRPRPPRQRERQMAEPALTFVGMPAPVEMALAALVLDGVFEDHPGLRCGVVEQGATWFPSFLRRLDLAFERFAHREQERRLAKAPSDYLVAAVRVTPFPFEDLRWLLSQTPGQPYLFGSDYPHDEGGADPVGACMSQLAGVSPTDIDLFFRGNFEHLMGDALPAPSGSA